MKLTEVELANPTPEIPHEQYVRLVAEWLDDVGINHEYKIRPDRKIEVYGPVDLSNKPIHSLPFPFESVRGDFKISGTNISEMKNCPRHCSSFYAVGTKIHSIDNIPTSSNIHLEDTLIRSLKGIHRALPYGTWLRLPRITEGGLGLLMIPMMVGFEFEPKAVCDFLQDCKKRKLDIHEAQEAMIDNGMSAWAKL